jgi:hypothetical protein
MSLSAFILGVLISTIPGTTLHLARGGGAGRLLLYILLSWFGFWGGHIVAQLFGWKFLSLGPIRLGMALFGSLAFLGLGYWLSLVDPTEQLEE